MTLATFKKQPSETQDYDIDFTEYLADLGDTASSHVVIADAGITINTSTLTAGVVKVWVAGGTDGQKYKITARITTAGTRVREAEITIAVKEA